MQMSEKAARAMLREGRLGPVISREDAFSLSAEWFVYYLRDYAFGVGWYECPSMYELRLFTEKVLWAVELLCGRESPWVWFFAEFYALCRMGGWGDATWRDVWMAWEEGAWNDRPFGTHSTSGVVIGRANLYKENWKKGTRPFLPEFLDNPHT